MLAPVWAQTDTRVRPSERGAISIPATLPDQEIGRRFTVKAEDLPPPKTGPIVASRPLTLPYTGQMPRVPEGFTATPFATSLEHPRRLLVLPNGDVLVAEQKAGHLTLLRDEDGDGKAEWMQRHVEGLNGPYGLAWRTTTCWSPTRTASGRCRTSSAPCAPASAAAAEGRRRAARASASRRRAWSARR